VFGQTQTKNSTQTEKATVTGKVTLKGKPAPGVVVFLRREMTGNPYENMPRGTTDQAGVYRISDLPPGSYQVNVMSPAYVIADSADTRVRMLVLTAGENVENVNFSIVRGGAITGKVTDSEGRPVIEQSVYAYRVEAFNQTQRRGPIPRSANSTTDDRGIYRIFGVAAGQYKIAVGRADDGSFTGPMAIGRASYQQTFSPNVADQTKATVIEVSEASEATNVDITVGPPLQTFSVAGRTVDGERFTPVPNIRFGLQRVRGEQMEYMNRFANSSGNGDFLMEGLLPGKYSLFLMPEPNSGLRVDAVEFEIVDHDVTGITVKVSKGAGISGVVVLENDDQRLYAKLSELQISAYVAGPQVVNRGMGQSASATVAPDGTFTLGGLPAGSASINVYRRLGPDQRWSVSRVEREGVEQAQGLEVKEGEQIAGVRVVVAYGSATLRGAVNLVNGEALKGGAFHIRLTKPGKDSPSLRPIQSDARGRFLAEGLPAGIYDIIVSYSGPNLKPRFQKQQVTLTDNTTTEVTVTFDLSAEPPRP
jgi:hypothetical protein